MYCYQQPYIFIKREVDDDFTELTISHPSSNQTSTVFIPSRCIDTVINQLKAVKADMESEQ